MDLGIKGKTAIVTGAASKKGIGNAIALALAREGANVALADLLLPEIESLAQEIIAMGSKSMALKVDQGIYEEVREAVTKINKEFGDVDILVNNAAIISNFGTLSKMEVAKWTHEINVSLNGPYYWIREVLPVMREKKWGRIVNISSFAGITGTVGMPSYGVSKGGLLTLTRQAAREGASRRVTANALALGMIDTDFYKGAGLGPETVEGMVRRIPLGRMGMPGEVADFVAFLCSERASYLTGAVVLMDGGITINI
jgi:3-oxoacyl-[acyl-carrier protein] reductase